MRKTLTFIIIALFVSEAYAWYGTSPYAYCAGDPINRVDLNGREWDYTINDDGSVYITLDVKLEVNANLTESQIEAYKSAINDFESVINSPDCIL